MSEDVFGGYGVRIELPSEADFLKIKESLTRIGIASKRENVLYQSCHILHKRKQYAIVHFKELFELDGKTSDISVEDIKRRNSIVRVLEEWGLVKVVDKEKIVGETSLRHIKILKFSEKKDWVLKEKYKVGKKK
jgi:Bacteriophage translational regulator